MASRAGGASVNRRGFRRRPDARKPVGGTVLYVAVPAEQRGHGIGVALITAAEQHLRADGRLGIMACLDDSTAGLYERLGWKVGDPGESIVFADFHTSRYGHQAWKHPAELIYPRWAWKPLDAHRPIRAWTLPDTHTPGIAALQTELLRQATYPPGR
ncbi:GNAT family N-acetyltransferase [Actinoplanes sp. URMC 104]|uniref:GNAT family N-acetyltransferase n=1 Tax=Actinoplanes sp. URMC 104 TaxID=3423409 RepID=UPI003F1B6B2E